MSDLREAAAVSTGGLVAGRYRLTERIGSGGMARVYLAEDTVLDRSVAVKVMHDSMDTTEAIERMRAETAALATLSHHSLVTLFDAHIDPASGNFLIMEYVEGITLRELIGDGPVPSPQAAGLAVDLAEGLHVAHTAGIVHRDIKPSNVLLWRSPLPDREWRAKLADFGIAHLKDSTRLTTPGLLVGTAAYIAPEQAEGAPPEPPADIYALGLLLLETLTGRRAYAEVEGIAGVLARIARPPDIPRSLPAGWRRLLRRMTARSPQDRPTALEVAVAASAILAGNDPTPDLADEETGALSVPGLPDVAAIAAAGPPPLPPRAAAADETTRMPLPTDSPTPASHDRRRARVVIGAAVAAVVLAVVLLLTVWAMSRADETAPPAPSAPAIEEPIGLTGEEPVADPDEVAPEPLTESEPVGEVAPSSGGSGGGEDTSGSGGTGGGSGGNGGDNRGPGNSNGNGNSGNGNSGNGGGNSGRGNG